MAVTQHGDKLHFSAPADWSANAGLLVSFADQDVLEIAQAADNVIGVLANAPKADETAVVAGLGLGSTIKVKAGGSFNAGDKLMQHATNGKAIVATTAVVSFGIALQDGADGDLVQVLPVVQYIPAA